MAPWQQAWERYALAAQIVEQMSFASAMEHKCVVLEIASNSKAEGRKPFLAMIYDELARCACTWFVLRLSVEGTALRSKEWEDLSGKLGAEFNVASKTAAVDEGVLRKVCVGGACERFAFFFCCF